MSQTVYNYRVYCTTDSKYVTKWDTIVPTTCPENNTHSIDANATIIIEQINPNTFALQEEDIPTGGHFKFGMMKINAPRNSITEKSFSQPFPINVLCTLLITSAEHQGDVITSCVADGTTVGVITASYTAQTAWSEQNYVVNDLVWYQDPDKSHGCVYKCIVNTVNNENPLNSTYWQCQLITFNVSSTVSDNVLVGFYLKFFNGVTKCPVGYVTAVDKINHTVTVYGAPNISYNAGAYVQMTIMFMDALEIGPPMTYTVGVSKTGSSYVPANTKIKVIYNNKSTDIDKKLIMYMEFLY